MADNPPGRNGTATGSSWGAGATDQVVHDRTRWLILLGLITAAIMEILDTTITNVAMPQMAGNLGCTFQEISWVATGYILSNVIVLPMTAFLTGRFGRKNYLTTSILIFIIASFFCGTSHSLGEIVFWRMVQGAGGAALVSTAQATLRQVFPKEEQGIVQALFMIGFIVAPTLGPTLGGYITDNYTWSWCFFINVPIGIVSMFLVTTFLHDPPGPRNRNPIDWLGVALLASGLGSLQYVLEEGQEDDWFNDVWIVRLTALATVTLIGLLAWELSPRNKAPVVDFRVLKNKQLTGALCLFVSLGFGLFGGIYLFPLFTQEVLGFSPMQTGLALIPGGIATAISGLFCGVLLNGKNAKADPRVLIYIGVSLFLVSMWQLGHMSPQSGIPDTQFALFIRGLGLGLLFTPINQVTYASMKPQELQQGAGLISLARQLGGSFGIAILATYTTSVTQLHRVNLLRNIWSGNPALIDRQHGLSAMFLAHGYSLAAAQSATWGLIDETIMRQARTIGYDDAFLLILVSFAFTLPAVLLLRRPKRAAGMASH